MNRSIAGRRGALLAVLATFLTACSGGAAATPTATGARSASPTRPGAVPTSVPTVDLATSAPFATNPSIDLGTPPAGSRPPELFSRQAFRDPAAENVEAIVFLLPDGWQSQASVEWMPAWERLVNLQTTVTDPSTGLTIEWLPIQDFIWFDAGSFVAPIGGNYQGKAYVPPITDPAQFVTSFWVPSSLPQLRNATLVSVNQQPVVAQEFVTGFGGPANAAAYRLRYEYDQGGQTWEEDVSFALLYSAANGITSWYVNFAYTARAPKGELDRNAGMISTVYASRVTTPEFEAVYRLVLRLFIQGIQQQMADTAAFGRTLAQYRAETQALQAQVTQERQASEDHIADLRGQELQGIETYVDPVNRALVQLPVGWSDYWVNQHGQYVATDPGFDPNTFNNGGWQRLTKRDP